MRLTALNPRWIGDAGARVGMTFDAPGVERTNPLIGYRVCVFFDPPIGDAKPYAGAHRRTGDTFETISISPSILTTCADPDNPEKPHWSWHGFVTNGEVSTC